MLDKDLLEQLKQIFTILTHNIQLHVFLRKGSDKADEMLDFVQKLCTTSDKLSYTVQNTEHIANEFSIFVDGQPARVTFRGIPGGHEFNSLLMAIVNADGKGKNWPDELTMSRIKALRGPIELNTFVSLTCTSCPDVVQALNIFAITNPGITHTMIDGAVEREEAARRGIKAVPAVFADDQLASVGRASFADLLDALEKQFGSNPDAPKAEAPVRHFDIVVFGGGPAGVSAAIYGARKGFKVAVVAKDAGGSVSLTGDIDNLITTRSTTGDRLAAELKANAVHYGAELFENRIVSDVDLDSELKVLTCTTGEKFTAPALIVAAGATPRHLNVPGETEYTGHGVAFCPHCDGPYFKDKDVVVVGGGNAGIEAAIDLAALCKHVTVLEFLPEMKADHVLIDRMKQLANFEAYTNRQVTEIVGDGTNVTAVMVKDRTTDEVAKLPVDGVFIQIGTVPNSGLLRDKLELNRAGEVITDRNCRTSVPMVYAAGDVATSPFKQIVVALGEGATATLSAFEDIIRKEN